MVKIASSDFANFGAILLPKTVIFRSQESAPGSESSSELLQISHGGFGLWRIVFIELFTALSALQSVPVL